MQTFPTRNNLKTNNLWLSGLFALIGALIATGIIQLIANVVLKPDVGFTPLGVGPTQFFTVIAVVGASFVYTLVRRSSSQPVRLFERIALVVLGVTVIPDLGLLLSNAMPGTNLGTVGALVLMHLAVWAITVQVLTRPDRAQT